MSKKVAKIGVLVALAMVFSYVEVLIPFNFGIPGVKLGVANIVVVTGFYLLNPKEVFFISIFRILLMGFLFGNGVSLVYSLSGGLLSFVVMFMLKKFDQFSVAGVSVAGGVFHNIGQITAAAMVLHSKTIIYYLPILVVAGVITGIFIGFLSCKVINAVNTQNLNMG